MKKNKYLISKEKIEFIQSLEEFFIDYEPKFGEKIKVRRFLAGLKKIKIESQDQILNSRLKKIKNTNLKKKDIEALKSVDEDIINDHLIIHINYCYHRVIFIGYVENIIIR